MTDPTEIIEVDILPTPVIQADVIPVPVVSVGVIPVPVIEVVIDKTGPIGPKGEDSLIPGPPGPRGEPGMSYSFVYHTTEPSAEWTIAHNMGKRPSVTIIDSANTVVVGDIEYISDNVLMVTFAGAFSGSAYLN
jgi:hypothetical protein